MKTAPLFVLVPVLGLLAVLACSSQTIIRAGGDAGSDGMATGSSSGGSGSSSGASVGCPNNFTSTMIPVKPDVCAPQLSSTTTCMGVACSWTVETPCTPDGGADSDGGDACSAACSAVAPSGANPAGGFCEVISSDGGATTFSCGACGV